MSRGKIAEAPPTEALFDAVAFDFLSRFGINESLWQLWPVESTQVVGVAHGDEAVGTLSPGLSLPVNSYCDDGDPMQLG
jgi:hypothetical protein